MKDRIGIDINQKLALEPAVEWAAAGELEDQGVTSQTLKVGDYVVITGSPARNTNDHRVRMATLHRPKDNFNYGIK